MILKQSIKADPSFNSTHQTGCADPRLNTRSPAGGQTGHIENCPEPNPALTQNI